ncbi:MAG TPA: UDP-2,3-diacylglucosamine diphosphatase LpxI [Methylomirabilota bacterium]|nr:UDP-2,3-diacylglucosamine diphosphatase LpxI [Methylomirabilota bacterium]
MSTLGLMCGAGSLPARMASEARRQGWRVVAFAFPGAADLAATVDTVVPTRIEAMGPVLEALAREQVKAVAFCGKFWMRDLLAAGPPDAAHARMAAQAGALLDGNITDVIASTLGDLGIELLDQRGFLGDWLADARTWSSRAPTGAEWSDIRRGFAVARAVADLSVGQTVVVRRGAVSAVEAIEGTTEAIRRGTTLSGPGAVVVKAIGRDHDFRFDTPAIGPETVQAAAAGGATALAVQAGRVLLLEREATVGGADAAGMALVSVDADG